MGKIKLSKSKQLKQDEHNRLIHNLEHELELVVEVFEHPICGVCKREIYLPHPDAIQMCLECFILADPIG